MLKKFLASLAAMIVLTASANAATVSIVGPDKVDQGDTFQIQIVGDFLTEGFLAGGVQLIYDPLLLSVSFTQFDLEVFPDLSCPGAGLCPVDPAGTLTIGWGQLLTDLIPVGAGPTLMATLAATALAPTTGTALTLLDFSEIYGGWFGASVIPIPTPEFLGAAVEINAIPLPAAVWMMIGGLGVLARFRRK